MEQIICRVRVRKGRARLTLEVYEEHGRMVCGIYDLKGRIKLPPRAWLRLVRTEMARLEEIARAAGCQEMRVAGRNWSRVLTDYEPFEGAENGLVKRL